MNDYQIDATKQNSDSLEEENVNIAEEVEFVEEREEAAPDLSLRFGKAKSALKQCEQEKKEYLEGWQRAKADHINYRKDEGKRFEDMARFVTVGMISDILPVLDSFDLALTHGVSPEIKKGILLIKSQLYDSLKKRGLTPIEVKPGDTFDPAYHEALEQIEVSEKEKDGVVLEELQRGYMIHNHILRSSKVKVGVYKKNE